MTDADLRTGREAPKREQRAAVRAHRAAWRGIKLCPRIMRKKRQTIAVKGGVLR